MEHLWILLAQNPLPFFRKSAPVFLWKPPQPHSQFFQVEVGGGVVPIPNFRASPLTFDRQREVLLGKGVVTHWCQSASRKRAWVSRWPCWPPLREVRLLVQPTQKQASLRGRDSLGLVSPFQALHSAVPDNPDLLLEIPVTGASAATLR